MCRGELYARICGTATSIRSKVNTMMANFKTLTYVTITIATLLCAAGEHSVSETQHPGLGNTALSDVPDCANVRRFLFLYIR